MTRIRQIDAGAEVDQMTDDFYCDEVLSGRTPVDIVIETENVLAYHHTRPYWPVHIVVIPKRHIESLTTLGADEHDLLIEMITVVQQVAEQIVAQQGGCRVVTNLGKYQDSKHLHWHVAAGQPLR
jgi:histidine triad (HIT) family protein